MRNIYGGTGINGNMILAANSNKILAIIEVVKICYLLSILRVSKFFVIEKRVKWNILPKK